MVLKADGVRMAAVSEALLEDVVDAVQTTSMHLKTLDDVVADAEKAMGLTEHFDPTSRYTCHARCYQMRIKYEPWHFNQVFNGMHKWVIRT